VSQKRSADDSVAEGGAAAKRARPGANGCCVVFVDVSLPAPLTFQLTDTYFCCCSSDDESDAGAAAQPEGASARQPASSGAAPMTGVSSGAAVSRVSVLERDARTKKVLELELRYDNRLTALLSTKKFDSVLVRLRSAFAL
jgi:hypothetical protein